MLLDYGTGDFRTPSFRVRDLDDGSTVSPFTYVGYRIDSGDQNFPPQAPHFISNMNGEATTPLSTADNDPTSYQEENQHHVHHRLVNNTLIIEMEDAVKGLKVKCYGRTCNGGWSEFA